MTKLRLAVSKTKGNKTSKRRGSYKSGGNIHDSPQIKAALTEKLLAQQALNNVKKENGKFPKNILNYMIQIAEKKLSNAETKYKSLMKQPQQSQQLQQLQELQESQQSHNNMNEEELIKEIEHLKSKLEEIPQKNSRDFTKLIRSFEDNIQYTKSLTNINPNNKFNRIRNYTNKLQKLKEDKVEEDKNFKERREIQAKINKLNAILNKKFPMPLPAPVTAPVTAPAQVTAQVTAPVTPQVTPKKGFFSWFTGGKHRKTHKRRTHKRHTNKRNKTKRNRN